MRKYSKMLVVGGALAALAVPSAAMADESPTANYPTADYWQFKDNTTYDQASTTGKSNAQITHNGWSVGGNKHFTGSDVIWYGGDQTTEPGSRAEGVTEANHGDSVGN
jgi:hypothetical protein